MYREIEELLILSKKGDLESKESLTLKLKPLILSSIRRYYNRIDLYDDLIQEGYEIILRAIEDYDPHRKVNFLGYVKVLLKYHYLDKHKEKQIRSLNVEIDEKGTEIMDLIQEDQDEGPEARAMDRELKDELKDALRHLTNRQKEVVIYFYIRRLSIGEISHRLGISYRTVVNTKTIAIKKLRKRMVK